MVFCTPVLNWVKKLCFKGNWLLVKKKNWARDYYYHYHYHYHYYYYHDDDDDGDDDDYQNL